MKKILIISDTHRMNDNVREALARTGPVDMMIHLGDIEGSELILEHMADEACGNSENDRTKGCTCVMIAGNNDFFTDAPRERELKIGKYNVLLTHGHLYRVSLDTDLILTEASARGYDIVMFGHTHRPFFEEKNGVIGLNPGSISYPRQEGRRPSYMVMTLNDEGNAEFETFYI